MNKELRLLLVSLLLVVLSIGYFYWKNNYTCETVRYQDLSGVHSEEVCKKVER
jgi:lipopolysaccharide export system protein LptC